MMDQTVGSNTLYDADFYAWIQHQAELLRAGHLDALDVTNLTEEIEALGRSEKRELVSRLAVLLCHLLKWQFQPTLQSTSWRSTIFTQRADLQSVLDDSPSLRARLLTFLDSAYQRGRVMAIAETNLIRDVFPPACPYTAAEILSDDFLPE